ncbi:unnamed protein product, partial [Amoebophrya sp. A120]|eukprot:GSA120T00001969001.1
MSFVVGAQLHLFASVTFGLVRRLALCPLFISLFEYHADHTAPAPRVVVLALYEVNEASGVPDASEAFPSPLEAGRECYCGDQTLYEIFLRWQWHLPPSRFEKSADELQADADATLRPEDFQGCPARIQFDATMGAPFTTRSYREDATCPADLAANAVRCSRMQLG